MENEIILQHLNIIYKSQNNDDIKFSTNFLIELASSIEGIDSLLQISLNNGISHSMRKSALLSIVAAFNSMNSNDIFYYSLLNLLKISINQSDSDLWMFFQTIIHHVLIKIYKNFTKEEFFMVIWGSFEEYPISTLIFLRSFAKLVKKPDIYIQEVKSMIISESLYAFTKFIQANIQSDVFVYGMKVISSFAELIIPSDVYDHELIEEYQAIILYCLKNLDQTYCGKAIRTSLKLLASFVDNCTNISNVLAYICENAEKIISISNSYYHLKVFCKSMMLEESQTFVLDNLENVLIQCIIPVIIMFFSTIDGDEDFGVSTFNSLNNVLPGVTAWKNPITSIRSFIEQCLTFASSKYIVHSIFTIIEQSSRFDEVFYSKLFFACCYLLTIVFENDNDFNYDDIHFFLRNVFQYEGSSMIIINGALLMLSFMNLDQDMMLFILQFLDSNNFITRVFSFMALASQIKEHETIDMILSIPIIESFKGNLISIFNYSHENDLDKPIILLFDILHKLNLSADDLIVLSECVFSAMQFLFENEEYRTVCQSVLFSTDVLLFYNNHYNEEIVLKFLEFFLSIIDNNTNNVILYPMFNTITKIFINIERMSPVCDSIIFSCLRIIEDIKSIYSFTDIYPFISWYIYKLSSPNSLITDLCSIVVFHLSHSEFIEGINFSFLDFISNVIMKFGEDFYDFSGILPILENVYHTNIVINDLYLISQCLIVSTRKLIYHLSHVRDNIFRNWINRPSFPTFIGAFIVGYSNLTKEEAHEAYNSAIETYEYQNRDKHEFLSSDIEEIGEYPPWYCTSTDLYEQLLLINIE